MSAQAAIRRVKTLGQMSFQTQLNTNTEMRFKSYPASFDVYNRAFSQSPLEKNPLSYSHVSSATSMTELTVAGALEKTTNKFPDKECLVFCQSGIRRTFSQLWHEVDQLAAGFWNLGFRRGDRVGIWGPSSYEWVLTQFATAKIGVILVNINPAYQVNELEFALRKVGCRGIVSAANFKTQSYYKMLREVMPEIKTSFPGEIRSGRLPEMRDVIMMGSQSFPGTHSFDNVMERGESGDYSAISKLQDKIQFDEAINIQFTSGTTGHPKGATLSHHNIVNNALFIGTRMGYHQQDDRILCQVPLYHCFGMVAGVLCMAVHGAANVFPVPGYDPQASVEALVNENCSTIYGTPTMYIDIMAEVGARTFPSLKKGIMAGSPCPVEVIQKADRILGTRIQVAYGSTETSPVVNLMNWGDPDEKRTTTVGRTLEHIENKIVNENGQVTPVGTPGEMLSRGYCVMKKYWADEEKTKQAIDEDGWYHSGDIGVMDGEGYFKVVGRIKDLIIRGGENIYPTEIEDLIHNHPDVDDVQVVGVPDERMGEEVAAWIRLKPGHQTTEKDIKEFCKGKLSHFKIPKHIKFVKEFPITITRKVQKFKMREQFAKELKN